MKRRSRAAAIARGFVLFSLLFVLCVGGVELLVCSVEDPALFSELVAPVTGAYRKAVRGVDNAVRSAETRASDRRAAKAAEQARAVALVRAEQAELGRAVAEAELARAEEDRAAEEARRAEEAERLAREEAEARARERQIAGIPAIRTEYVPVDPEITALVAGRDTEYLLGGNIMLPYFNQADEAWRSKPFGVDPIGSHGCGPTSLSMAVSGLTGELVTPEEMAAWTASAGYAAPHSGSYLEIVQGTAEHFGLDCAPVTELDAETLRETLGAGGVMVALMGPGHFTRGGHFILLHGVTLSGDILVADPYSRENSLMPWDAELILSELSSTRHAGSPLWLLTVPARL